MGSEAGCNNVARVTQDMHDLSAREQVQSRVHRLTCAFLRPSLLARSRSEVAHDRVEERRVGTGTLLGTSEQALQIEPAIGEYVDRRGGAVGQRPAEVRR